STRTSTGLPCWQLIQTVSISGPFQFSARYLPEKARAILLCGEHLELRRGLCAARPTVLPLRAERPTPPSPRLRGDTTGWRSTRRRPACTDLVQIGSSLSVPLVVVCL